MEQKTVKHGNHILNNDHDGYMYNFNTSDGHDFNSHFHKCYEFIHVIHGQMLYTVEGTDYILEDGDFIMTKPDELHSFSFPHQCEYQREFLHIYPGFIENYPQIVEALNSRRPGYFNRFNKDIVKKYNINKIFRAIEQCCAAPNEDTDFLVLTLTLQLLTMINRVLREESPESQEIVKDIKANAVRDYIDNHYDEEISLDALAKKLYISQSYLSRVFKSETGMTIKTYTNMRRVTRAKNLIMQGQRNITNLFWECGFKDYSTFYRAFIKYVGMSPEEFRSTQSERQL